MSTLVFSAIIVAAVLHAVWNALVKGGKDKHVGMTAMVIGQGAAALVALFFVPMPEVASWPYIALSAGIHIGYQVFLLYSYRIGDLTQVYPIARGSAPLIVGAVSVLFLGVHLEMIELIAIATIGAGILSLVIVRQSDGGRNLKAAGLAFMTGCFIAAYSLIDGFGARIGGTSTGYYSWVALINAMIFCTFMVATRPRILTAVWGDARKVLFIGGGASYVAYALVVWAFTQAPIALVTALRETSIVFALLIGVFFLNEKLNLAKVVSTMITLFGAALLRISKG